MRSFDAATRPWTVLPLLGLAWGCGAEAPGTQPASGPSVTAEIRVADWTEIPGVVEATGSIRPWSSVSPGTKILGRVEAVTVREGDRVRRGQTLVRLERRDLEAVVEQARAAVAMAEAQLDQAVAQHDRMRELHGRRAVTDKNLEDAVASFRVAEAAVRQARANLVAAEVTLGYAEVRSPVDGFVTDKRVEPGDMAAPGIPLLVLEDLSRIKVRATVPESEVVGLSQGDPAEVRVEALASSWDASIDRIDPTGDPASATFEVELVLDNPAGRLRPGMFARVRFAQGTRSALLVPSGAVVARGALEGLFVLDDEGRARLRWVRTGRTFDEGVEVLSGLEPGERYVAAPPLGLADGTPVTEG